MVEMLDDTSLRDTIFLKLGGSLLTDKTSAESLRADVLDRLAQEIAAARQARPVLRLILGHGSGSFGHVAAAKYRTREGVESAAQWAGFAEVADAAARLNRHVLDTLLRHEIPAVGLAPSASAICRDGHINSMAIEPIRAALDTGLLPVVFGDVAFDSIRGGTIVSTEEVLMYLAPALRPRWLLLAGETDGVLDAVGRTVEAIDQVNYQAVSAAITGSRGTDVTGGMASKVAAMLALTSRLPWLSVRIFSGLDPGNLKRLLVDASRPVGTLISSV